MHRQVLPWRVIGSRYAIRQFHLAYGDVAIESWPDFTSVTSANQKIDPRTLACMAAPAGDIPNAGDDASEKM